MAALSALLAAVSTMAEPGRAEGDGGGPSPRIQLVQPSAELPTFALLDQEGRPFGSAQMRGATSLVFFGYANCGGICPATLQVLRQATREAGGDGSGLRAVFISVDGERDSPAAVRAFLDPFGPAFIGLTGEPVEVTRIAGQFSAVFFKGTPRPGGGYDMEHTSQVYLVDRQGRLRATFYGANSAEIATITRTVMKETP